MSTAFGRGWRQLRVDARRYILASVALTAGVALLFGTLLTIQGITNRLEDGVNSLSGIGDVGVVPAVNGTTIAEHDARVIEAMPGVDTAIRTSSTSTTVRGDGATELDLTVTGYPVALNDQITWFEIDGRLPAEDADEVLVPDDVLERLSVDVGDQVTTAGAAGGVNLTVVGVADAEGLGALAYDNMFVDLATAERIFATDGDLTRVDLLLEAGHSAQSWQATYSGELPPNAEVQDTAALTASFGPLLDAVALVLLIAACVTIGVAALLAHTAFEASVRARSRSFGLMRAVGATGRQVARSVVVEALMLSGACALLGLGLGFLVSAGFDTVLTSLVDVPAGDIQPQWWQAPVAGLVGVGAGLAGAGRAAIRVLRLDPQAAITAYDSMSPPRRGHGARIPLLLGAALTLVSVAATQSDAFVLRITGLAAALGAAAVLAPSMLRLSAGAFASIGWTARMAAVRSGRDRGLSTTAGATACVVCFGTALVIGVSAIGTAMTTQMEKQFGADVQITIPVAESADPESETSTSPAGSGESHDSVEEILAGIPGIATVSGAVTGVAQLDLTDASGEPVDLSVTARVVDPSTYFDTASLPWQHGDDATTPAAMREGEAVILPAATADTWRIQAGDTVTVHRNGARADLVVAGTYMSLSTGNQLVIDREAGSTLGLSGTTIWNVQAEPGTEVTALRDTVDDALDGLPGASVITGAEMRNQAVQELSGYTASAFTVVAITLGLGAVGAAGVFAMTVVSRERELAALRAAGARRSGVRALVIWDAVAVATAASILGLLLGQIAGTHLSRIVEVALGTTLNYSPAIGAGLAIVVITFAALLMGAIGPSRRAAQISPAIVLRAET